MDSRKKSPVPKKSSPSQVTTVYLLIYNGILTVGLVKSSDGIDEKGFFSLFIDGLWFCLKQCSAFYPTNRYVIWANAMDCGMPLKFHLKSVRQQHFWRYEFAHYEPYLMMFPSSYSIGLSCHVRSSTIESDDRPHSNRFSRVSCLGCSELHSSRKRFVFGWCTSFLLIWSGPIDVGNLLGSDRLEYHRNHSLRLLHLKLVSSCSSMADMVQVSYVDQLEFSSMRISLDTRFSSFFIHWESR